MCHNRLKVQATTDYISTTFPVKNFTDSWDLSRNFIPYDVGLIPTCIMPLETASISGSKPYSPAKHQLRSDPLDLVARRYRKNMEMAEEGRGQLKSLSAHAAQCDICSLRCIIVLMEAIVLQVSTKSKAPSSDRNAASPNSTAS